MNPGFVHKHYNKYDNPLLSMTWFFLCSNTGVNLVAGFFLIVRCRVNVPAFWWCLFPHDRADLCIIHCY